jgi:steroid delta-isomerase-like uncharacterized protein
MTVDAGTQFARAWATAWSSGDPERVVALFTSDCVYEDVTLGAVNRGSDELRGFASGFMSAIPDFSFESESNFAGADWLTIEWRMTGTHVNDLPGMPATGRRFDLRGATVIELADGRGKVCRDYWDMASLLKQLGLMS